jgi:hypothetical protein
MANHLGFFLVLSACLPRFLCLLPVAVAFVPLRFAASPADSICNHSSAVAGAIAKIIAASI